MKLHIGKDYKSPDNVQIDEGINELFKSDRNSGVDYIRELIDSFLDLYGSIQSINKDNLVVGCGHERDDIELYIKLMDDYPSDAEKSRYVDDDARKRIEKLKKLIHELKDLVNIYPHLEPHIKDFEDELKNLENNAVKLGEYIPKYDKEKDDYKPVIILYLIPISCCANYYGCTTKELATIVLAHELIHAFYDSKLNYVNEKEEPLAEMGCIHFLKEKENEYPDLFNIAYKQCKDKLNSPYLKHYGFGATLYDITNPDLHKDIIINYRNK